MDPLRFERSQLATPQEELSHLREVSAEHAEQMAKGGIETTPEQATAEIVKKYAQTKPHEVLHPDYAMPNHEAESITVELSPEAHDRQLEHFIGLMEEKGIRNTMSVIEKMNNPHLMDDFHRFLVQFISSGYSIPDLKERDPLWKPLHMTLFEVSLPDTSEEDKQKQLKELISGMEQFYSGMLSISNDAKDSGYFCVEIANANGSEEFIFYVSVPTPRAELFEKQILSIFPNAHVIEHKDDFNIFNDGGASAVSYAKLSKHFLYPLKGYESFDVDPLNSILNSFSKIDQHGEGASVQFIIGSRRDAYMKTAEKALEKMRKGEKISKALSEIDQSVGGFVAKEFLGMFKSKEKIDKEKEEKEKRAQAVDQTSLEQFTRKLKSPFISLNIRIVASAATEGEAHGIMHDLESTSSRTGMATASNGRPSIPSPSAGYSRNSLCVPMMRRNSSFLISRS